MSNSGMSRRERDFLVYLRDLHAREQGGLCYYCKVPMTPADVPDPKPLTTVTIEHLKPLAQGGGSNYLNTAASCLRCNNGRSRRKYVRGRDIPKVRLVPARAKPKPPEVIGYTYVYTVPSNPFVFVLANMPERGSQAEEALRLSERMPITVKAVEPLTRESTSEAQTK